MHCVMVLNDGETFTDISGCSIVAIPEEITPQEEDEFVRDAVRENTPSVLVKFD